MRLQTAASPQITPKERDMALRDKPRMHRLKHQEHSLIVPVKLETAEVGDVFIRQGTPCMRVGPADGKSPFDKPGYVWIVNLTNGSCWPALATDEVYMAFNANLTFDTARRGD